MRGHGPGHGQGAETTPTKARHMHALWGVISLCLVALVSLWRAPATAALGQDPHASPAPGTLSASGYGPVRSRSAVYPPQELPLRFNHQKHLAKGMQCTQCHTEVARSRSTADRLLPTPQACDGCHGSQHPVPVANDAPANEPACSFCHVGAQDEARRITASVRIRPARLRFSHALHMTVQQASAGEGPPTRVDVSCERCHGDMSKVRLATEIQLPKEQSCLECHDGGSEPGHASDTCATCHPSGPGGQLITAPVDDMDAPRLMPRKNNHWRGAAHDLNFVQDHKSIANANPALCDNCHGEDDCLDCHAGVLRPMRIHAGDYLVRHGVEARMGAGDCQSCHQLQDDCIACHERTGMGARGSESAFGVGSAAAFHPPGWAQVGGASSHAFAAQRNLAQCASCHSEDTCLACHATAAGPRPGLNVSPHGPRFAGSLQCSTLASRNRRACLQCHAPGAAALDCR